MLVQGTELEVKVAGVTALHRAFNIKGLGLQPHLSGPIDAKGFSGALTNLPARLAEVSAETNGSPCDR